MKSKNIKKVFERVFKYTNPIFCFPVLYFKHNRYLCEVAVTPGINDMRWNRYPYQRDNPLLILEGLFVDSGMWITVLEVKSQGSYIHRTDLSSHIENSKELQSFINKLE